jgi:hypothetical protein
MLVLRDRSFDATAFRHGVAATGAMFVARARGALPSTSCCAWPWSPRSSRGPRLPKIRRKTRTKQRQHPKPNNLTGPAPSWMAQTVRPTTPKPADDARKTDTSRLDPVAVPPSDTTLTRNDSQCTVNQRFTLHHIGKHDLVRGTQWRIA